MKYTKGPKTHEVHVHWDSSGFYTVYGYKDRGDQLIHGAAFMDGTDPDTKTLDGKKLIPVRVELITREVLEHEV